jgi:hypothetical protein
VKPFGGIRSCIEPAEEFFCLPRRGEASRRLRLPAGRPRYPPFEIRTFRPEDLEEIGENNFPGAPGDLILKNKSPRPVGNLIFEKIVCPASRATLILKNKFPDAPGRLFFEKESIFLDK